ncbi:MAG TPA: sigma 54-interacting transcriptional regulator [Candidatus Binatia bacterium]|nr:sigma 54-interacting transcriptional regulator [Candidatus Binatia bacterium]
MDQAERYRTLLEINNAVISNLDRDALFHAIAEALRPVVPFDRTAIFLHDPDKDVLRISILEASAAVGHELPLGTEVSATDSHAGWVFQHGEPLVRQDLAEGLRFPIEDRVFAGGFRSYVMLPLVARGKSLGTLGVASSKPNQYGDTDVSFLREVATQIAMAVENMNAYASISTLNAQVTEAAERARALLEINNLMISNLTQDALFRAIAHAVRRVIPFDRTALCLHDPARDVLRVAIVESSLPVRRFTVGMEFPVADTHMGQVFRSQRPLLRGDVEVEHEYALERLNVADGVHSLLVVPLIVRGASIGTLGVSSTALGQYTMADAVFLQEVANQVAMAIQNMKAYEEISTLKARLERENVYLQEEIRTEHNFVEMIGSSPALLEVLRSVERVAPTDATVLISGETGTGKELVARAVHARSARSGRPLVKVNCGAISAGLVESELFGHVKGAFTGALERRLGRFEVADGGTIFLDEIGELPLDTQVKLLRVLQEGEFEPVGASTPSRADVRVIAATNRDLEDAVRSGRFRADLFYRLNVFPIHTPPLRERVEEIPQLVAFFVGRFAPRFGKTADHVSPETMDRLVGYAWPGNVRELQNVVERAVILAMGPTLEIGPDLLGTGTSVGRAAPASPPPSEPGGRDLDAVLRDVETRHVRAALERAGGVIEGARGAARILGLHPNTLRSRIEKLGIRRSDSEVS